MAVQTAWLLLVLTVFYPLYVQPCDENNIAECIPGDMQQLMSSQSALMGNLNALVQNPDNETLARVCRDIAPFWGIADCIQSKLAGCSNDSQMVATFGQMFNQPEFATAKAMCQQMTSGIPDTDSADCDSERMRFLSCAVPLEPYNSQLADPSTLTDEDKTAICNVWENEIKPCSQAILNSTTCKSVTELAPQIQAIGMQFTQLAGCVSSEGASCMTRMMSLQTCVGPLAAFQGGSVNGSNVTMEQVQEMCNIFATSVRPCINRLAPPEIREQCPMLNMTYDALHTQMEPMYQRFCVSTTTTASSSGEDTTDTDSAEPDTDMRTTAKPTMSVCEQAEAGYDSCLATVAPILIAQLDQDDLQNINLLASVGDMAALRKVVDKMRDVTPLCMEYTKTVKPCQEEKVLPVTATCPDLYKLYVSQKEQQQQLYTDYCEEKEVPTTKPTNTTTVKQEVDDNDDKTKTKEKTSESKSKETNGATAVPFSLYLLILSCFPLYKW